MGSQKKDVTASGQSVTRRTLHHYWKVTRAHLGVFLLAVIATVGFTSLLSYANPYVMGLIVNKVTLEPTPAADQVLNEFAPYIVAMILVNLVGQACSKLQDYAVWKLEIGASYDLATECFDTLANQSMTFHTNRFGGSLVSQTSKFLNGYTQLLETLVYAGIPIVVAATCTIGLLAPLVPMYVAILVVLLVVYVIGAYALYKKILPLNASAAEAQNSLSGELSDSVTNILSVKTYGREDYERGLFDAANRQVVERDSKRMRSNTLRGVFTSGIIVVIMVVLTFFVAGGSAWFGILPGTLVMMFTYTYSLSMQFNYINNMLQRINRSFGDAHDMTVVLDEPRLVADAPDAKPLVVREGAIDFNHLNFWYDDGGVKTQVFDDFNLHIPAGQRIGLVGRSGAGKTTLTKLLLRLSDIQEGEILVDGQNIATSTQQSLRRQIAYVPQEALLFHRTIAENIAYGKPDATMDEIREAARQANALEFIEKLPQGFDTVTGERGVKLSGGQRQRVAIARAILADAPILVLDEATSALDSESEKLVQDALMNLMRGRTSIVVAHRLSTVASLDRIVVISNGTIVEDGTHAQLIEDDGEYAHLWNRQTGAFLEAEEAEPTA
jgi:ATP-binding cassette subfamily B protein